MNKDVEKLAYLLFEACHTSDDLEREDIINDIKRLPKSMLGLVESTDTFKTYIENYLNQKISNYHSEVVSDYVNIESPGLIGRNACNIAYDMVVSSLVEYPSLAKVIRGVEIQEDTSLLELAKEHGKKFKDKYKQDKVLSLSHEAEVTQLKYFKDEAELKLEKENLQRRQSELYFLVSNGEISKQEYMQQLNVLNVEIESADVVLKAKEAHFNFNYCNLSNQADSLVGNTPVFDRDTVMDYNYESQRLSAKATYMGYRVLFAKGEISEEELLDAQKDYQARTKKIDKNQQIWIESEQNKKAYKSR